MSEPTWPHLKRVTTKIRAPQIRIDVEKAWGQARDALEQRRIQAWMERIPRHIEKIIELKGGNEYREGKVEKARRFKAPLGSQLAKMRNESSKELSLLRTWRCSATLTSVHGPGQIFFEGTSVLRTRITSVGGLARVWSLLGGLSHSQTQQKLPSTSL